MAILLSILLIGPLPPEQPTEKEQQRLQDAINETLTDYLAEWADGDTRPMVEFYYSPSPASVSGWATRYGPDFRAISELRWTVLEAQSQYEHADYMLLGGGYGYHIVRGKEYLFANRASMGFGVVALPQVESPQQLNEAQERLLMLAAMNDDEFWQYIKDNYAGVISTRTPNNIGREFCLVGVGLVIAGQTSALHDFTPLMGRTDALGLQMWEGKNWIADLPDNLYTRAGGEGGPVSVTLADPRGCAPVARSQTERVVFAEHDVQ